MTRQNMCKLEKKRKHSLHQDGFIIIIFILQQDCEPRGDMDINITISKQTLLLVLSDE